MNQKLIFIDEPKPHQAPGEARTTMRHDILSRLLGDQLELVEQPRFAHSGVGHRRDRLSMAASRQLRRMPERRHFG